MKVIGIIGLMMIVFSVADLVNLGLKTWVFPKAEDVGYYACPIAVPATAPDSAPAKVSVPAIDSQKQCADDQARALASTIHGRQSSAVRDLSFLVVGLPLFAFHFRIAQKERREEKDSTHVS